jgi:ParB-like chromosome segregation protein Spo0J
MHIETVAVEALRPYERNARTHSNKQVRQIARSIERFGFCNPVLIDDQGQIIAGHGRVAAAKLLGIKEVPTVKLAHLSDAEKRAYILADNRLAEKAGWDREILAIELQALVSLDFEVELTGFETAEVDLILDEATEAAGGPGGREDETPVYKAGPAVTRPGDLWELGPHRLLCADARDPAAYVRLLDNTEAEFVFTDPPYNVPIDGHVCGLGRIRHADFAMGCGEMSEAEFKGFLEAVFQLLADNTVDGSIHQVCMDWRHMPEMLAAGNAVYQELGDALDLTLDADRALPVRAGLRFDIRHSSHLTDAGAALRRHHRNPAEADRRWRGREERAGQAHCLWSPHTLSLR